MPRVSFRLRIPSILPTDLGHIPFAPEIDFPALIASAGAGGVLDPNSIEVYAGARRVEYALGDDLLYGDRGRVEWAIDDPECRDFEVRFCTTKYRKFKAHPPRYAGGQSSALERVQVGIGA